MTLFGSDRGLVRCDLYLTLARKCRNNGGFGIPLPYGRGAGVGRGFGVGAHLPVHGVGVGVGVAVAVAVGVGVPPQMRSQFPAPPIENSARKQIGKQLPMLPYRAR